MGLWLGTRFRLWEWPQSGGGGRGGVRQLRFICFEYVYEHVNLDFKIVLRYDFYACVNDTLQWAPWQLKHANQMRLLFIYINFDLLI